MRTTRLPSAQGAPPRLTLVHGGNTSSNGRPEGDGLGANRYSPRPLSGRAVRLEHGTARQANVIEFHSRLLQPRPETTRPIQHNSGSEATHLITAPSSCSECTNEPVRASLVALLVCMLLVAVGLWVFDELIKSQADLECHPFAAARCGRQESVSGAALWGPDT
jgi:hypothetical protein